MAVKSYKIVRIIAYITLINWIFVMVPILFLGGISEKSGPSLVMFKYPETFILKVLVTIAIINFYVSLFTFFFLFGLWKDPPDIHNKIILQHMVVDDRINRSKTRKKVVYVLFYMWSVPTIIIVPILAILYIWFRPALLSINIFSVPVGRNAGFLIIFNLFIFGIFLLYLWLLQLYDRAKERPKYIRISKVKRFFSKQGIKRPKHVKSRIHKRLDKIIKEELNKGNDSLLSSEVTKEKPEYIKRSKIKKKFGKQGIKKNKYDLLRICRILDKQIEEELDRIINILPKMTSQEKEIIFKRKTLLSSDLQKVFGKMGE